MKEKLKKNLIQITYAVLAALAIRVLCLNLLVFHLDRCTPT